MYIYKDSNIISSSQSCSKRSGKKSRVDDMWTQGSPGSPGSLSHQDMNDTDWQWGIKCVDPKWRRVGGFTNPFETYALFVKLDHYFPFFWGWKIKKSVDETTTQLLFVAAIQGKGGLTLASSLHPCLLAQVPQDFLNLSLWRHGWLEGSNHRPSPSWSNYIYIYWYLYT